MMTKGSGCEQIRGNLSAFLDGEVSQEEREEVSRHLAGCSSCREQKKLLEECWTYLGGYPTLSAGDDFDRTLFQRLSLEEGYPREKPHPKRGLFRGLPLKPVAVAAAAVILILVGLQIFNRPSLEEEISPVMEQQIIAVLDILENMEFLEGETSFDLVELLDSTDYEAWLEEEGS